MPRLPKKLRREELPPGDCLCDHCTAKCCKYFALPIETPTTRKDFDYVRWYLLHGEATVFIPVEGGVRAIGRVTPVTVPAAELAVIGHHGSLSDADLSYATLGSYATRHEISIDGPLREYYLRGAGDTPDEAEWRTEIGWPIFRADAIGGTRSG